MKKIFLLFAVFTTIISQSCKKDSTAVDSKPAPADIPLKLQNMRLVGDSAYTELPDSSIIILKADYTWTLDVRGAKSFGTYTWENIETYRAKIKFAITQWTQFGTDPAKSNKLKNILLTVDKCDYPGPGIFQVVFIVPDYTTYLSTYKQ